MAANLCPLATNDGYVFATGTYCPTPFIGPNCALSDAATCNGRGTVSLDASCNGQCSCPVGWNPTTLPFGGCHTCAAGFLPLPGNKPKIRRHCLYSDATTCNNNGAVDRYGTCTCNSGCSGTTCQLGSCTAQSLAAGIDTSASTSDASSTDTSTIAGVLATLAGVAVVVGAVVSKRRLRSSDAAAAKLETTPHMFYNEDFVNPRFTLNGSGGGGGEQQSALALLPAQVHELKGAEMIDDGDSDNDNDNGEGAFNGFGEAKRESLDGATKAEAELVDQLNLFSRRGSLHYFPEDGFADGF